MNSHDHLCLDPTPDPCVCCEAAPQVVSHFPHDGAHLKFSRLCRSDAVTTN